MSFVVLPCGASSVDAGGSYVREGVAGSSSCCHQTRSEDGIGYTAAVKEEQHIYENNRCIDRHISMILKDLLRATTDVSSVRRDGELNRTYFLAKPMGGSIDFYNGGLSMNGTCTTFL